MLFIFKDKSLFQIAQNTLHILFKTLNDFTENVFTLRSKETLNNCVNQSEHSLRYFFACLRSYLLHICWKTFEASWNSVIVKLRYLPRSIKTTLNKMVRFCRSKFSFYLRLLETLLLKKTF